MPPIDAASYKVGVKNEVVDALRQVFLSDYPDPEFANRVDISLEYPLEAIHYPRVMLSFNEGDIHIAGVGHRELTDDGTGHDQMIAHWRFDGSVTFAIYALTNLDRDLLSSAIVNIIAFHGATAGNSRFYTEIFNSEYIDMQLGMDKISASGDQVEDVPWDDPTRKQYTASYSVPIIGEFYALRDTGALVTIDDVEIYPYRDGQPLPTGSTDPRDIGVPWQSDSVDI